MRDSARRGVGERCGRRAPGRGEDHRLPVEQEPRPEREALGAAAPVLEVDDAHTAGLLDPDHGAAPAGLGVLDDEAGLGLHLGRGRAARGGASRRTGHRSHSGRHWGG